MSDQYVDMVHRITGKKILGVHVDSVKAHEALGWVVAPAEEKPVEAPVLEANNDLGETVKAKTVTGRKNDRSAKNATR
jgi:hypothetical protein